MIDFIRELEAQYQKEEITLSELEFARFLFRLQPDAPKKVIAVGVEVFRAHQNGNICIHVDDKQVPELQQSILVGKPGDKTIFILENNLLYLQKYWRYEQELANWLLDKSKIAYPISSESSTFIENLFPESEGTDWQKKAVQRSLEKELIILTGGPGTGKTYTIRKIIDALIFDNPDQIIHLAAPTGKAAQRLNDSFPTGSEYPIAQTIHSLLGARMSGDGFKFNSRNPLKTYVLIIDEASMLDIGLWIGVIRAIPERTKLILVGDPHQLASVEAGSILGDICTFSSNEVIENQSQSINDCIVNLEKNRRFGEHSGLKQLSEAIKKGEGEAVIELLESEEFPELLWEELSNDVVNDLIDEFAVQPYKEISESINRQEERGKFQILSAYRRGPYGSQRLNELAEKAIKAKHSIPRNEEWFDGRSIIVTRNQRSPMLRNGEIGIYDSQTGYVEFDGREENEISPSRIHQYEPSQCITIHKSQGSEFEKVAIMLPEAAKTLLTKELLYTAVTRARQSILVLGNRNTIIDTVRQSIERTSGLTYKIWERS